MTWKLIKSNNIMTYNNSKSFFEDDDLKTPEHDKMLLWCLKDENIINILKKTNLIPEEEKIYFIKKHIEFPILKENNQSYYTTKTPIGFLDIQIDFFDENKKFIQTFNVEIKPKIQSIGETIRQINNYRLYLTKTEPFILITKTKDLKDIFQSQNIYVFEYSE